ncbi:hypothetical protein CFN78_23365 [Amycolatopsis antarctica]|uniref:Uncharacterized protein n=1 Tax=Amycolatopsis antarctica TaxID=1854586 RepID=A0A263CXJ9_9PSEU|nr:hypothetical protein [Amycolatopsis antarctica]OZM70880.1 hypothetical protein CFN78_23365 [Amycolatopsis antarctica]
MTNPGNSPDSWKTPQIREAEAKLDGAMADLDRRIAKADQVRQSVPATKLSADEIRQIQEFARGKDAPRELRELQRRIDNDELSWSDIADGRHLDDPAVRAALSTSTPGMQRAYTLIQEGEHLDDIVESGTTDPSRPDDHYEGDGDGEGGSGFMRRGW